MPNCRSTDIYVLPDTVALRTKLLHKTCANWVTYSGAGVGVGDFVSQMITSNEETLEGKFMDVNLAAVGLGVMFKNPFVSSALGSALDYRLEGGFKKSLVFGDKTLNDFVVETIIGSFAGVATDMGQNFLNANSISNAFNKFGAVTFKFGEGGATSGMIETIGNLIQGLLQSEKKDEKTDK